MRRAALGEAATTACSRPAPISAFASAVVSTVGGGASCPAGLIPATWSPWRGRRECGQRPPRIGRIVHGVVRGDGLDGRAPGLQALAAAAGPRCPPAAGARCPGPAGQMSSRPVAGLLARGCQVDADAPGLQLTAGRRADRGHQDAAGQPAAEGGAPLRGFGLERLDGGHAADHEPRVGPGAEGVEGDVQGVLVAGLLEVDQRQQQRLGADTAQGRDEFPGAVRAAGNQHAGALRHPHAGWAARAGCGRCAVP